MPARFLCWMQSPAAPSRAHGGSIIMYRVSSTFHSSWSSSGSAFCVQPHSMTFTPGTGTQLWLAPSGRPLFVTMSAPVWECESLNVPDGRSPTLIG